MTEAATEIRALREREERLREALRWALGEMNEDGGCGCGDDDCSYCGPFQRAVALTSDSPQTHEMA